MNHTMWFIGISLSITASFFGTVGKVLLKLSHTSLQSTMIKIAATFCIVILNPVFDAFSYDFAAQSILAPMAGLSVVWNIILSPYLLNEIVTTNDLKGTAVIFIGCVLVAISGSHINPIMTSDQIYELFFSITFFFYVLIATLLVVMFTWIIWFGNKGSKWRRFGFGALSGLVGGNLFFLKASVSLLAEGGDIWSNWMTYLIFAAALGTPACGIFVLDIGLREFDAIYLVAVYQAFLISTGSVSGLLFFHEAAGIDTIWQMVLYPFSIIVTVSGIMIMSEKHAAVEEIRQKRLSTEVMPLLHSNYHSQGK